MTYIQNINDKPAYRTLEEIRLRKAQLLTDIAKDNYHIGKLWNGLFHKKNRSKQSPSRRFTGILNTGAGVLDGLILGWKLYRKLKRR